MANILKAVIEATNSAGGYTVPDEFSNRLLALIQQKTITQQDLDVRKMISDVQYIPKVTDGSTAYWPAETASITHSNPVYGQITLTAKKIASLVPASSEVLEDNNVDLANHLVAQMATDLAIELDNQNYNGTGSPWYGLRSTATMTNAVDGSGETDATAAAGTASTITGGAIALNTIITAITEVLQDNHEQPDVSYWNPRTVGSLLKLTDGNARPVLDQTTYGSPLQREGVMGIVYGTKMRVSSVVPINLSYGTTAALSAACSDALIGKSKMFALQGNRRGFIWKTAYEIDTDVYKWQTTARYAFAAKYPNAYCLIRGITD